MRNQPFHAASIKKVFAGVKSSSAGLSEKEAGRRLAKDGQNTISAKSNFGILQITIRQFASPLVYILIIASIAAYLLGEMVDAIVIAAIIVINAIIGVAQEWRAEVSLRELKKYIVQNAIVLRNGKFIEIESKGIVVGDIVKLTEGASVPADLRLFKVKSLKVDESVLTGESVPSRKSTSLAPANSPIIKRQNMVFAGTNVVTGTGLGVVVSVASQTEFGRLAVATTETSSAETPLNTKINQLGRIILISISAIALVIALIGIAQGQDTRMIIFTAVALAVAAIPEGLPAIVTISLAVGVTRMAKKNAITRKLSAIETLGAINVIASDKTGTLTENKLTLKQFHFPDGEISFEGSGYNPKGRATFAGKPLTKNMLSLAENIFSGAVLASDADLKGPSADNSDWQILGDPTEGAILVAAQKLGVDIAELRQSNSRLDEIPFSSDSKMMATVNQNGSALQVNIKGNLNKILSLCSKYQASDGKVKALTKKVMDGQFSKAKKVASSGYRLLAFAKTKGTVGRNLKVEDLKGATFLGFVAMIDAPRPSAIEQVHAVKASGIRVVMITGDLSETASAIAKMMSIGQSDSKAISETELLAMNEHEFGLAVANNDIFAEISPSIKLKIVKELEGQGKVVAVTGDGANDAPILKRSAVGIAVGLGGTDIARASSDIILADNNFATIVSAIKEGRLIFENIRRAIWYLVSTNATEILVVMSALIVGAPLPLAPTQILWVNVITDGTGAIGLALEKSHENFLKRPPRSMKEPLINKAMVQQMAVVALAMTAIVLVFFFLNLEQGIERARTMTFVSLATLQIFNLFNARSFTKSVFEIPLFSNKFLLGSAVVSLALIVLSTELAFFQNIFETTSISMMDWLYVVAGSLGVIIVMEIYKKLVTTKQF